MSKNWGGRTAQQYRAAVLSAYGDVCHLCGRPGATTVDHIIPRKVAPELALVVDNGRPAHYSCNSARGATPLGEWLAAHPWPTRTNANHSRNW